jgi:uncharacterized phage-associated protein
MFNISPVYTKDQLSKIGNAIVFLCEQLGSIPKTKLLKLIYLIEENSIKQYGMPFFNVNFKVWHLGPVEPDLYAEFTSTPFLLSDFIKLKETSNGIYIDTKVSFSDDEFSNNEIEQLKYIVENYGSKTGSQLIDLTHKKGSPWYTTAERTGLLDIFEHKLKNSSNETVDLLSLIDGDQYKLQTYNQHCEFLANSGCHR